MPYKDPEIRGWMKRVSKRNKTHPGWRQIYIDSLGMCQYPDDKYGICGNILIEFHEPFGESRRNELKFQQRICLCRDHHTEMHGESYNLPMIAPTKIHEDIDLEIYIAGGYQKWLKKFGLVDKWIGGEQLPCMIETYSQLSMSVMSKDG